MAKPWGGVGAWALEAEREEAEEREIAASATASAAPPELFPSLKEAVAAKPQKKKKGTTVSLSEFTTGAPVGPGTGGAPGTHRLTHDEMLRLPTGPKERSAEEMESSRLGGGFRSYGYGSGGGGGGSAGGRRTYGGGFEEENRRGSPQSRASDLDMPSRADEVDNWAAGKKASSFGPMDSGPSRNDRYGSLGGGGSSSKADDADSWSSNKKPAPATAPPPSRYSGFGSGFRDSAGSSDSDRWTRGGGGGGGGGVVLSNNEDRDLRERPRLVLDRPKGEVGGAPSETGKTRPSPFGAARPREEVLAEKGMDWRKMDTEIGVKKPSSRPTSSHSSRPSSEQSSRPGSPAEAAPKARPKVNPFGEARPREVLLEQKGKDWRKIDLELEHRRFDRPETEEEKQLKEEINQLKKALTEESEGNVNGETEQISADQQASLRDQISQREKELEKLIRDMGDKVRFGQRAASPGASRIAFSSDRPPSQSGMFEDPKGMDLMDRPQSHGGTGDSWGRPLDDRRGFQGGRETGFLGNRSMDRSRREGW